MTEKFIQERRAQLEDLLALDTGLLMQARSGLILEQAADPIDRAVAHAGRETSARSLEGIRGRIVQVKAALDRIDHGDYGVCQSCGEEILEGRLKILPYATRDVKCQEAKDQSCR